MGTNPPSFHEAQGKGWSGTVWGRDMVVVAWGVRVMGDLFNHWSYETKLSPVVEICDFRMLNFLCTAMWNGKSFPSPSILPGLFSDFLVVAVFIWLLIIYINNKVNDFYFLIYPY